MWSILADFLNQPFNSKGNAAQWFAFVGVILISLWLWHLIAKDFGRVEGIVE